MPLVLAVRIHLQNTCANRLFLFARVAAAANGNVNLFVSSNSNRTCQMPTAILVTESIVGKSCEQFQFAGRFCRTFLITVADEFIGEGKIEPVQAFGICVEGDAVWIA